MNPFPGQTATNVAGLDFSQDSTNFVTCGAVSGGGRFSLFTVDPLLAWTPIAGSPKITNPSTSSAIDCRISPFNGAIGVTVASRITIYDSTLSTSVSYNAASGYSEIIFDPLAGQLLYIDTNTNRFVNMIISSGTTNTLTGPTTSLSASDFMSNGNYIATGGSAKVLYIYNSSRVSYERWSTTDQIRGVVFNKNQIFPKLYVGDTSG